MRLGNQAKQRIVLRRLLQNRLWLLAMTSRLSPYSRHPWSHFFSSFYFRKLGQKFLKTVSLSQKTGTEGSLISILLFSENWDKDMGKSGHKFPERGTNVPENWDGIHFLLSIRYNFQFLFRGRLRSSAGLPMLGSLRLWKEGNPLHSKIFLYFFLEKSRSETDTGGSWGKCPRNFETVLFRITSLATFLPLLTKSLPNDWGATGVIVAWADGESGRRTEGQLEML